MTRYVLMAPDGRPQLIYRNITQFARATGFRKHNVYNHIKKKGKHTSELGTLWPVEMPVNEGHSTRKGGKNLISE